MASRRCFDIKFFENDNFADLSLSAQALYFHLNLSADDEGIVASPNRVKRSIGASDSDLNELINSRFLIAFDDAPQVVIKAWNIHNTIPESRKKGTNYTEIRERLHLKENKMYTLDLVDGEKNEVSRPVRKTQILEDNDDSEFIENMFDFTFSKYPKKSDRVGSFNKYVECFMNLVSDELNTRKAIGVEIHNATMMYVKEFRESNVDKNSDAEFRYMKSFKNFLENDLDYWLKELRKNNGKSQGNEIQKHMG